MLFVQFSKFMLIRKKIMYDHVITSLLLILPYPWAMVEPRYPGNSSLTHTPMPIIVVLDEPLDCKQAEVMAMLYIYISVYVFVLSKSECRFCTSLGRLHQ